MSDRVGPIGRGSRLPERGERRTRTARPPAPARAADGELRWFVVAAPGLEPLVHREVMSALPGAKEIRTVEGGVEMTGPLETGYRANLWLRVASRVVARVGEVEARDFAKLRRRLGGLPWERFLAPGQPIAVAASSSRSRLYHTGALGEIVEHAVADRAGSHASGARPPEAAPIKVILRGVEDRFTASVDSSGDLLHRRGWRKETGTAPLRETLAAALLELLDWDPGTPFVDPMCGAGTLPIEACARAMRRAPGLGRGFAFERWPAHDGSLFTRLREEASALTLAAPPAAIVGSDADAAAVTAARRNAERAGLGAFVRLDHAELGSMRRPDGTPGVILANPPYGRRIGQGPALRRLHADIGRLLRAEFRGWRAGLLVADQKLLRAVGIEPSAVFPLRNGGLRVKLARYELG